MSARRDSIIAPSDRIGLSRMEAAAYIGVSTPTFDQMVRRGLMPAAKVFGARRIWDRRQIEQHFANLPDATIDSEILDEQEAAKWAM